MNNRQSIPLHRRPGRRVSNSASPTTGPAIFHRRQAKSSDGGTVQDVASPNFFASISPSIDLALPSPTFDTNAFSPVLIEDDAHTHDTTSKPRSSEDEGKHRPSPVTDWTRPASSGAAHGESPGAHGGWRSRHFQDTTLKSFTVSQSQVDKEDVSRHSSGRDSAGDGPGPSMKASNTNTFTTERGLGDESSSGKATTTGKRSRLNLLNPMSLLARRRSSQNAKLDDVSLNVSTLHVPAIPDNFDPSIRGNIVHDFSVPRNRRIPNELSPRPDVLQSPCYPRRPSENTPVINPPGSAASTPGLHSPVFREHFQDDRNPVQPTRTSYLHNLNLQAPTPSSLPTFAKRLPFNVPEDDDSHQSLRPQEDRRGDPKKHHAPPEPEQAPPPPPPPPVTKTPSPVQETSQPAALPKHMTSTSSRFSFQIGGQGSSTQEKLLEEKHKEHASKGSTKTGDLDGVEEDDYQDYDFSEDDFEEKIPGVNADDDDEGGYDNDSVTIRNIDMPTSLRVRDENEEENLFDNAEVVVKNIDLPTRSGQRLNVPKQSVAQHQSLSGFHFTPQSLTFSPTNTHSTAQPTPRDAEGFPIGLANWNESPAQERFLKSSKKKLDQSDQYALATLSLEGLGISARSDQATAQLQTAEKQQKFDDSDLYFDDGEFDTDFVDKGAAFNEDLLDGDESGKIRDIPAENARKYEEALQKTVSGDEVAVANTAVQDTASFVGHLMMDSQSDNSPPEQLTQSVNHQAGLTEGNLSAYHDALVMATAQAVAEGRFERQVSFSQVSDEEIEYSLPLNPVGLSSSNSRHSTNFVSSGISDEDGFPFDDDGDDDLMIAEANAEALENDDEGFYGQEFGFYARSHNKDSTEFANGGFFTSRGSNGVKRSHSGKANFQEPSLTPITEKSEWSARNSVASLPMHGGLPHPAYSLPSPGLAQLIEQGSSNIEDEMTLSALLRLRRGAFGGSSTSVNSLGERHNPSSSPLAGRSNQAGSQVEHMAGRVSSPTPMMVNSMSMTESEDDAGSQADGATLTHNTPQRQAPDLGTSACSEQAPSSPIPYKGHHRRTSSGAESVSYTRDKDGHWFLERRRTGDDGKIEVVGREYLTGVHI